MASEDIDELLVKRIKLEGALRTIRTTANNAKLNDTEKVQEIRKTLSNVQELI